MAIKNVQYTDYATFKAEDRKVRKTLKGNSDRYVQHVMKALDCFHTGGNHNIQIVNDVLDTATAARFQRGKVAEWLEPVVGHELLKGVFGKKVEGLDYNTIDFASHFESYGDWYAFSANQPRPEYDIAKDRDQLVKAIQSKMKRAEKNGYLKAAQELLVIERMLHNLDIGVDAPANAEDVNQVEINGEVIEGECEVIVEGQQLIAA